MQTADEYERLADAFMAGPLRDGALECFKRNRDKVRFDPRTEEFGVASADGVIKTFLVVRPLPGARQTAMQYFRSNCND